MASRACIWLTRPQEDSLALATLLKQHGIESIVAPLMQIEHCSPNTNEVTADALLLTSRHAAHALAQLPPHYKELPVFCVGSATAQAARAADFLAITEGESDVLALLPRMVESLPVDSQILYLAGEETRVDVATLLAAQQRYVTKVIAYKADAVTELSAPLREALAAQRVTGAVFFSPRSAALAAERLNEHGLAAMASNMEAYCLSLAVAETAGTLGWKRLHACAIPTQQAMVDLIVSRSAHEVL